MCEFGWIRILGVRARGFLGSLMEISTPSHKTLALSQSAAGIPGGFQWGRDSPKRFYWEVGSGLFRQSVLGKGRGECLGQERPLQAQSGWGNEGQVGRERRFTLFSPVSWEGQRFTGQLSTGSWMLWTSLWALAVTTVSKTRYCDHGPQGRVRLWAPDQDGCWQLSCAYF